MQGTCMGISNNVVCLMTANGKERQFPLSIFPSSEQARMHEALGETVVPKAVAMKWGPFTNQLAEAEFPASCRALVKVLTMELSQLAAEGRISKEEAAGWTEKANRLSAERRQILFEQRWNAEAGQTKKGTSE